MRLSRLIPVALLLLSLIPGLAQTERKRLILKDGSYQIVLKYEVAGDRVRYLSAERNGQQEEIPSSLIDWPATDKWNKEHEPGAQPAVSSDDNNPTAGEAAAIDKEEQAQRDLEKNSMPTVIDLNQIILFIKL